MPVEDLLNTPVCATEKYDGQNLGVLYYPETDRFGMEKPHATFGAPSQVQPLTFATGLQ